QLVEWTDNVEKMEDFTVRIHTKSIFPLAIEYLVNTGVIYPHKYYTEVRPEGINEKPVGTAPYSIAGQKRGRLVSLERLSLEMLASISLLAARETAFVGTIGFMGLVGPHVARMLVGEDQRYFVPVLAAAGTLILSVASTLAKG